MKPTHRTSSVHALNDFDWNLLKCLDALLEERNVTRAAKRVGLSQPAMSRALGRLRVVLDDDLFVRVPGGMEPTSRAVEVSAHLGALRQQVEQVVTSPQFEPSTAHRTFALYGADFAEALLVPELMRVLARVAPHVSIHFHHAQESPHALLRDRTVDLVLHPRVSEERSGILGQKLFDESFLCIARKGHPAISKRLSLKQYCESDHLLIAPRGRPGGIVDRQLAGLGLARRVRVQVPSFLAAPRIVATTDIIATIPERLAEQFCRTLPLRSFTPPLEVPPFTMMQYWSSLKQDDPAHRFLRRQIQEVCQRLTRSDRGLGRTGAPPKGRSSSS